MTEFDVRPRTLKIYQTEKGTAPYLDWVESLSDKRTQQIIDARLTRITRGLIGHSRYLGEGVSEIKIDFGPGYRVYFGVDGLSIIVLLCGGSKSSQEKDIHQAKIYWADYLRRTLR
jgi:putative addiction module killer protein